MKTIVSMGELREAEIKPSELLAEYHRFFEKDVRALWSQAGLVRLDSCPACGSEGNAAFEKWGVAYRRCSACRSLYAFERPGAEVIERHYAQSKSATYWREKILNRTEDARQQKVLAPRAEWVLDGLAE
ncbi:MAG: hypothetical protein JO317_02230, partial [Verrucomicrobiae bacterium]|nr:hypothetical protein [Verrucomicrobiae bacterium]